MYSLLSLPQLSTPFSKCQSTFSKNGLDRWEKGFSSEERHNHVTSKHEQAVAGHRSAAALLLLLLLLLLNVWTVA
jgi:hypothetical protein